MIPKILAKASRFSFCTLFCLTFNSVAVAQHSFNIEYYELDHPKSIEALLKQLNERKNKKGIDTDAETTTNYAWKILTTASSNKGSCKIEEILLDVVTKITMPKVSSNDAVILNYWAHASSLLLEHELMHYENHRQISHKIQQTAYSFEGPCLTLRQDFRQHVNTIFKIHMQIDIALDDEYKNAVNE